MTASPQEGVGQARVGGGPPSNAPEPPRVQADPVVLAARIRALVDHQAGTAPGRRVIIGLAGGPGAGKSTLAEAVVAAYGPAAALVGMDGFHLAQAVLDDLGLAEVKGAPETFDVIGYLALLRRLRSPRPGETVYAPQFRRAIEEPVAGAVPVPAAVQVVLTEGNYLLYDDGPWADVRGQLAEAWFLDLPDSVRLGRLIERHIRFGRTAQQAHRRAVTGSDARNALIVANSRHRADLLVVPDPHLPS
jgi:pantothenate kinase